MPIVFGQDLCGHWVFRQFFFDWASPTWLVKAAEIKRQAIGMHECARTLMNANTAQKSTQTHTHTHIPKELTISWPMFAFDIWAMGDLCFFVGRSSNILSPFTSPNVVRGRRWSSARSHRIVWILVFEVRRSANLSLCGLFDAIRECLVGTLVGQCQWGLWSNRACLRAVMGFELIYLISLSFMAR